MDYMPQSMGYMPQQQGYGYGEYVPPYDGYPLQQNYAPQYAGYMPQPQQGYMPQESYVSQYGYAPQPMYAPQYGCVAPALQPAAPINFLGDWGLLGLDEDAPPSEPADAVSTALQAGGQTRKQMPKALRVLGNLSFWAICIALIAGSVLFALSKDPRKSYFGYRTYSVKTESMTPKADGSSPPGGFGKGALILVKMCKAQDIKIGDIITFNPSVRDEDNQLFLTHRVVDIMTELGGKEGLYFVTRGDFNNSDDPPISADMLIGKKVFSVAGVGTFLQQAREHFALALATIICLFACIFMFRWYFSKPKDTQPKELK